jgi:hypothetical protein
MEACEKVGRSATCAQLYKEQMIAAGFTNVVETKYIWPSMAEGQETERIRFVYPRATEFSNRK